MAKITSNALAIGNAGAALDVSGAPNEKTLMYAGAAAGDQIDIEVSTDGATFSYLLTITALQAFVLLNEPYAKIRTNNAVGAGDLSCNWTDEDNVNSSSQVAAGLNLPANSGNGNSTDLTGLANQSARRKTFTITQGVAGDEYAIQFSRDNVNWIQPPGSSIRIPSAGSGKQSVTVDVDARYVRVNAQYSAGIKATQILEMVATENNIAATSLSAGATGLVGIASANAAVFGFTSSDTPAAAANAKTYEVVPLPGGAATAAAAGGVGGPINLTAGAGGAGSATQAAGAGGAVTIAAGAAGANAGGGGAAGGACSLSAGNASDGANGGAVTIGGGTGGPATAAAPGGAGGQANLSGGTGGAAGAAQAGGTGANAVVTGGAGGAGSAAQGAGAGGAAQVLGGNAGANGGGGGGNGGSASIDAGTGSGAGVNGNVNIGATNAVNVNISRAAGKVGFFGAAAVAKQTSAGDTHTVAAGSVTNVFTNTTFDGSTGATAYTIGDIVKALKAYGLLTS